MYMWISFLHGSYIDCGGLINNNGKKENYLSNGDVYKDIEELIWSHNIASILPKFLLIL